MNKVKRKKGILKAQEKSQIVPVLIDVNEIQKGTAALLCCPECGKRCRTKLA
ncbi:MAG: hypothetical protein LLG97_10105 [Deltaproteobacteria bacterium]|nr:hypothetical protein [Deltaproteobacteria bacterium]